MKKILLILLCLWAFPVAASHIVGGEFEIIHISGIRYRINLILYFDELNGSIGARDPSVDARIFRKRDNALMMNVFLPFSSQTPVSYTQPACSNGEIVTSRILYTAVVQLTPQQFSDAEGYYLSWERCCSRPFREWVEDIGVFVPLDEWIDSIVFEEGVSRTKPLNLARRKKMA